MIIGGGLAGLAAAFRDGRILSDALPDEALRIINASFEQVHPGDIRDYIPERQRDAIDPLYPDHFEHGNGCAVEAYLNVLGDRVELAETASGVRVHYRTADLERDGWIDCAAAIVASPAHVASGPPRAAPFFTSIAGMDSAIAGRWATTQTNG
ncbi:hypothetical protein [Polyangium sp. 15x6]|uniref:hypothetical protein n=1 Tax=Polyangium sp. 15x6 TaxID=3042687 RepID=UPI00249C0803|nr:hypothetical protein [Polyangium sp. 15x6]MDI3288662.1 hypothetical protein [Polyangium sp. 15x6]